MRGRRGRRGRRHVALGAGGEAQARGAGDLRGDREPLQEAAQDAAPPPREHDLRRGGQRALREELREAARGAGQQGRAGPAAQQPHRGAGHPAQAAQPAPDGAGRPAAAHGGKLQGQPRGVPQAVSRPRARPELDRPRRAPARQGLEDVRPRAFRGDRQHPRADRRRSRTTPACRSASSAAST